MKGYPAHYLTARKGADGRYRLFFIGTRNEAYPGETFDTAAAARMFVRVAAARRQ